MAEPLAPRPETLGQAAKAKLRSRSGESLAEVMVAILVAAIALVMLAATISSAVSITLKSESTLNDYYEQVRTVAAQDTASDTGTVTVTAEGSFTIPVNYYESDGIGANKVISYARQEVTMP